MPVAHTRSAQQAPFSAEAGHRNFVPFFTYEKGLKYVRSILLTVIPATLIIDEDRLTQSRNEYEGYENNVATVNGRSSVRV
jgi:hypothetical protein